MGFECALALVLPEADTVKDYVKGCKEDDGDIFFDERISIPVATRSWRVFKWIDFGSVRTLEKSSSSLSPEERAAGSFDARAAKCAASFLLGKFFECEQKVVAGNFDYAVPFVADHYRMIGRDLHEESMQYRFEEVFAMLGSHDVVKHLWGVANWRKTPIALESIFEGALWEHNRRLLHEGVVRATTLEGHFYESPCGLVWASGAEVAHWLEELLMTGGVEGHELRKDPRAVTLVKTWQQLFADFAVHGIRAIMLTGSFHADCSSAMRHRHKYL